MKNCHVYVDFCTSRDCWVGSVVKDAASTRETDEELYVTTAHHLSRDAALADAASWLDEARRTAARAEASGAASGVASDDTAGTLNEAERVSLLLARLTMFGTDAATGSDPAGMPAELRRRLAKLRVEATLLAQSVAGWIDGDTGVGTDDAAVGEVPRA